MKENQQFWLWVFVAVLIGLFSGLVLGSHLNNERWLDAIRFINCTYTP